MIDDLDRTAEELLTREFSSALLETPMISFFGPHCEFVSKVTLRAIDARESTPLCDPRQQSTSYNSSFLGEQRKGRTSIEVISDATAGM